MNSYSDNLALLRTVLHQNGIDAYVIPLSDPHLGEYIPDHWKIIRWLTGFTGSSATVVVTGSFAGLWTDSRYFIQAERELAGSGFILANLKPFQGSDYAGWLAENLSPGCRIGFDGRLFSISRFRKLQKRLEVINPVFDIGFDPVSDLWTERPRMPLSSAWDFPVEYAGKERSGKIEEVRIIMKKRSLDYHLITSPDDIMWLLNIRGNDVSFSPLILSFALIGEAQILLFVDEGKIPRRLAGELDRHGVVTLPYEETSGMISTLSADSSILIPATTTSVSLYNSIPAGCKIVEDESIPALLKAIKNKTEIENISRFMVKDGVALTRFFYHIESDIGTVPMTEVSLAVKLQEYRTQQEGFMGPSFATITAYNSHAALPHYSPSPETDSIIGEKGILLVDSGGQYMGGTTDISRSIAIGMPSPGQKKDFTLVLKGHINLAMSKFPHGTKGYQIDMLARKALWENGLDYGHGTGHGVGYSLNVHEGPQNIGPSDNKTIIEAGMLISNEPAIYREGEYGIRTENLMICYEDEETDFGHFLKFETISLCYIDKALIDKSLLDNREISWLNSYHTEVFEKLSPHLNQDEKLWLKEKTEPIS
jgi:Xaa-Pro aminopeptidase